MRVKAKLNEEHSKDEELVNTIERLENYAYESEYPVHSTVTIELSLDDYDDLERAKTFMRALDMDCFISEIWDRVFRPCFKHGYGTGNKEADKILNSDQAYDVIDKLADVYNDLKNEYEL